MDKQVFWSVLPERSILERPFIHFMQIAERAGINGYHYIPLNRMRTDLARDAVVAEFKRLTQNPDDALVLLDADHNHEVDTIERLVANDKPVCAALAFRSNPSNPSPCFWVRTENGILKTPRTWERGLIRVAVTGTGAIAIKRSVFTALDEAGFDLGYFKYQYHADGTSSSEEIFFSQLLERCSIPVFVDTTLVTPHCADAQIDESSWVEWCADHPVEKREHRVSVIIPQRGRFEKLKVCLESLKRTAPEAEVILVTDIDESDALDEAGVIPDGVKRFCLGLTPRGAIEKWNHGASLASGDVLMVAANDVVFEENWMPYALDALDSLPDACGVVSVNDGHTTPEVSSPHFLMSRDFAVKYNGGVLMPPCYEMMFPDVEVRHRAQSLGRYATAKMSRVIHDHPLTGSAEIDSIHREGYLKSFDRDRALFLERQKQDFPLTWDAILK